MLALQRLQAQLTEEQKQALEEKRRARLQNPMNWLVDFARERNGDFRTFETTATTTCTSKTTSRKDLKH